MIIRSNRELKAKYHQLGSGDAFAGHLSLRQGEELKVFDLIHRGVKFFPSALSQFLSRSKVLQAEVLSKFMLPDTFAAYRSYDLIRNLRCYARHKKIVSKRERKHLGMGLSLWSSLEELQSLDAIGALPYPLVIQPFLSGARDFRVVVIGEYIEGYERINPHSFRKNLAQKGTAQPVNVDPRLKDFCLKIMNRGDFPYALLDILLSPEQDFFLSEISLMGGLTGSKLGQDGFLKHRSRQLDKFCSEHCRNYSSSPANP